MQVRKDAYTNNLLYTSIYLLKKNLTYGNLDGCVSMFILACSQYIAVYVVS